MLVWKLVFIPFERYCINVFTSIIIQEIVQELLCCAITHLTNQTLEINTWTQRRHTNKQINIMITLLSLKDKALICLSYFILCAIIIYNMFKCAYMKCQMINKVSLFMNELILNDNKYWFLYMSVTYRLLLRCSFPLQVFWKKTHSNTVVSSIWADVLVLFQYTFWILIV